MQALPDPPPDGFSSPFLFSSPEFPPQKATVAALGQLPLKLLAGVCSPIPIAVSLAGSSQRCRAHRAARDRAGAPGQPPAPARGSAESLTAHESRRRQQPERQPLQAHPGAAAAAGVGDGSNGFSRRRALPAPSRAGARAEARIGAAGSRRCLGDLGQLGPFLRPHQSSPYGAAGSGGAEEC